MNKEALDEPIKLVINKQFDKAIETILYFNKTFEDFYIELEVLEQDMALIFQVCRRLELDYHGFADSNVIHIFKG